MKENNMYKVYIHRTTTDYRVFYVGNGKKYRPYETHQKRRSKEWNKIYKKEGCIVEILYETDDKEEALELEALLIQEYKRISDGGTLVNKALYNNSRGKIVSDETREKIGKGRKGRKHTEETKQRISEAKKSENLSDDTKQRMSEANSIPILQYNKDGTFIRDWKSATEAANTLNIHQTSITACCRGKRKSAGGFVWKYKKDSK